MSVHTSDKRKYHFAIVWTPDIADCKYTRLPLLLIRNQGRLKITTTEMCVLTQIISYRWTRAHSFPAFDTIASNMGVSRDTVKRAVRSLEKKGYLRRRYRTWQSNEYDISLLISVLNDLAKPKPLQQRLQEYAERRKHGSA